MRRRRRLRIVISLRAWRGHLARFVSGSFAIHGVLLAAVLIIPATRHRAPPIEDTMVVALAGPIAPAAPSAGAAAAPPSATPAPAPPPTPKEAHTVREVPAPKPKKEPVKPKKAPEHETAPEKPPADAKPAPATPGTGSGSGVPQGTNPAPGQGAVSASIGGGDASLGWYGAAVKAALEAAWAKPVLEDAAGTASVVVTFEIARDGATRNIRILQSSGIPSLDRSAQRAVIEASPLPAVPPTWSDATLPVTMRFDLTPEAR